MLENGCISQKGQRAPDAMISGRAKSVKDEGKVQCNCTGNQGIFVSRHVESGPVRKTNIHSQPHTEDFSGLTVVKLSKTLVTRYCLQAAASDSRNSSSRSGRHADREIVTEWSADSMSADLSARGCIK